MTTSHLKLSQTQFKCTCTPHSLTHTHTHTHTVTHPHTHYLINWRQAAHSFSTAPARPAERWNESPVAGLSPGPPASPCPVATGTGQSPCVLPHRSATIRQYSRTTNKRQISWKTSLPDDRPTCLMKDQPGQGPIWWKTSLPDDRQTCLMKDQPGQGPT